MSWPRVFSLIACNLIWAVQPVFAKVILQTMMPLQLAWLRFSSAALTYLLLVLGLAHFRMPQGRLYRPRTRKDFWGIATIGIIPFMASPLLQTAGMASSQAVDSVLIVAMEPVISIVLAWVILKERLDARLLSCLALAMGGFVLLSANQDEATRAAGAFTRWQANLLILLSVAGEGIFSIAGRSLVSRGAPALGVFGTGVSLGALLLTVVLALFGEFPKLSQFTPFVALGVFWMGVLGTTLGYAWWLKLLEVEKVGTLVISLFIQPVAGSIAGVAYLGEKLSPLQWLGACFILLGVMFSTRISTLRQE
jgi:drug/metabolite transporter (DMT)-like permease